MSRNDIIDYINNNIIPSIKRTFSPQGLKSLWTKSYTIGIILILLGLLCMFLPVFVSGSIGILGGIIIITWGVTSLLGFFAHEKKGFGREFVVIKSVFLIIVGVIFIMYPMTLMSLVSVLVGGFFLVEGFVKVRGMLAIPYRRSISWWITFLLAAVVAAMGMFIIFFPFKGTEAIIMILGVMLIISGCQKIVETWRNRHIY